MYEILKERFEEIITGETNFMANASNFASLVFNYLKDINWVGFYFLDGKEIILGPFQGKVACVRIPLGKGVCGTSARNRRVIIVDDVHKFPGHIPCDPYSKSEIVVPLIYKNVLYGVLDIDSPILNRFSEKDRDELVEMMEMLVQSSDIEALSCYYKV